MKMTAMTSMTTREDALAARRWFLIDAGDQVLGRVATKAANMLRGKEKPEFTPHVDCGDFVVVVNAAKVRLTGRKLQQKMYYRHSGYPGGIRSVTAGQMRDSYPERLIRLAIEGMLPKNRLGKQLATKLKVYPGADHPHSAQQPTPVKLAGGKDA